MAVHLEAQETELPPHFGEWLVNATTNLSTRNDEAWHEFTAKNSHATAMSTHTSDSPIPVTDLVAQFEGEVAGCEKSMKIGLDGFVEFVRQAGLNDDVALKFDAWTVNLDLAQTFTMFEEQLAPRFKAQTAFLRGIARDWNRRAAAGDIKPDLPKDLSRRVTHLDARAKKLARQIIQREDNELIARLLIRVGKHRPLTAAEKIRLSDAIRTKVTYRIEPSPYREDWYGDNAC